MNKEIYNAFIEAEKLWGRKIESAYDNFFNKFKNNYEKMAELMLVIKDRFDYNIDDEKLSSLYLQLRSKITAWSNENLNEYELDDFCKLADNYSIIKETQN